MPSLRVAIAAVDALATVDDRVTTGARLQVGVHLHEEIGADGQV